MNLKLDFYKLNKFSDEVSTKLYSIYMDYLNYEVDFPYDEVNKLVDRYERLYFKVYKNKNSGLNKILCKINFFGLSANLSKYLP